MSVPPRPGRALRRFALGSGPLKRGTDRVEFAARILLVLTLLLAAPLGVVAGRTLAAGLDVTVHQQSHDRLPERATLLRDAAAKPSTGSLQTPTPAAEVGTQAVVAGVVTFLAVVILGLAVHLTVVGLLDRRRSRDWESGWLAVQPLWGSHFG